MALKVLMLRKKINDKKKELESLRAKDESFVTRESELEAAINEASTEEEQQTVEESISEFETERTAHEESEQNLSNEIEELERELALEEEEQNTNPPDDTPEERNEVKPMNTRTKFFGMNVQEREAFVKRDDVQKFLTAVKGAISEKRALTGAANLIPEVMIDLLRENVIEYSKLYKHVYVRRLKGTGRMPIEGTIPEAVWTEMCANLNELDLTFSKVEVDGFKVGGYFKICNAILEDSDIDLTRELLDVLGRAIGLALDKAILYGTGTKMPVGIVTALAGVDDTPNIVSHASTVTGLSLYQAIVGDSGLANSSYSRGAKVWVMNEKTYTTLLAQAMSINASGAIVSGVNGTMPVIGGDLEVLNFIPDNVIIGGYFDLYLLAERADIELSTSEHAFWVADQTGFKGTARYDGKVLDTAAFVVIGLNGVTPNATMTFAADSANAGA